MGANEVRSVVVHGDPWSFGGGCRCTLRLQPQLGGSLTPSRWEAGLAFGEVGRGAATEPRDATRSARGGPTRVV